MRKLIAVSIALSCLCVNTVLAVENFPETHYPRDDANSTRLINFQVSAPHKSKVYSCNLIKTSKQCREYEILESANSTLDELSDGCQSMGGTFAKTDCPVEDLLASCIDIVRNYHRPDVIYSNQYYSGKPSNWDMETLNRVCGDLGGELE